MELNMLIKITRDGDKGPWTVTLGVPVMDELICRGMLAMAQKRLDEDFNKPKEEQLVQPVSLHIPGMN